MSWPHPSVADSKSTPVDYTQNLSSTDRANSPIDAVNPLKRKSIDAEAKPTNLK